MRGVALLFLAKAVVLALFVTPLWDVPDETGHYAIVADLADGKGWPTPGRSVLPPDVASDWAKAKPLPEPLHWNWVAQHPPLYHLLAVPFLGAARVLTPDAHWRYRSPRLLSAISGALTLLVLFRVFWEASGDGVFAFASASAVGFLPMFSHMSSGTNHDVFLALLCSISALYWIRLSGSGRFADGAKMAAALALAGVTKLSALPVAAAMLLLLVPWIAARGWRRLAQWLAMAAISFSLPALWTLRHFLLLGNARLHPVSKKPFDAPSLLAYLRDYPVVDHTFKNFVGLIGWTASGATEVRWFQISGAFLAPYLAIALAATVFTAVRLWQTDRGAGGLVGRAAALFVFLFCALWLFGRADGSALPKRLLYSALAAAPMLALPRLWPRQPDSERTERIVAASQAVFLLFGLAYLINSWEAYEIYNAMRATNGRYFFAVLPFLGLAFLLPAARLWVPGRLRDACLLGLVGALFLDETAFYLWKVIPFFHGGPA